MTLTNRLLLFFLGMLAVVLLGFSTATYFLTRENLYRRTDERLEAALNVLAAAVEIKTDGLEWEPEQRQMSFGPGPFGEQLVWIITDPQGRVVDKSRQADAEDFLTATRAHLDGQPAQGEHLAWSGQRWQARQLWMQSEKPSGAGRPRRSGFHAALTITVGAPVEPIQAALRELVIMLASLSSAIWLVALVVGRKVCRRALRPVQRMAAAAQAIHASALDQRLPSVNTGDELQELGRSFNHLLDRLHESFERQRRFTGDASHQLRTPLTAMLGQIEVALRRPRPIEEYERVLTAVQSRAQHLHRIVQALLFLAREDAQGAMLPCSTINLRVWLADYVGSRAERPRAGDLRLDVDGADAVQVEVPPILLEELLNNLLDNAAKFSEPGTPIDLCLRCEKNAVKLTVRDQGFGIAPEDQTRLFEPFFRSADARRRGTEGIGLGLAIAKRLAKACQGELTVTSQLEKGSSFTLRLRPFALDGGR